MRTALISSGVCFHGIVSVRNFSSPARRGALPKTNEGYSSGRKGFGSRKVMAAREKAA